MLREIVRLNGARGIASLLFSECFYLISAYFTFTISLLLFTGEPTEQIHALPPCPFKVGNKVKVDMDPELLKTMQEGHGGWNPKMAEVGPRASQEKTEQNVVAQRAVW